jgi:hypothetical protein
VAIPPQKHSNHIKDPNHACLQPTSINIARPHTNGSIETKLIEGVGNLRSYLEKQVVNQGGRTRILLSVEENKRYDFVKE